jgi:putative phosphoribosyl transferase
VTGRFADRAAAGAVLARLLASYRADPTVTVLGLVRGGVPVAAVVADCLGADLDVLVVRKLGVPWAPEVAFGAIGPGGIIVLNDDVVRGLDKSAVARVTRHEEAERARRELRYRAGRPELRLDGRTAVVVDDGMATGATARAAVEVARRLGAARVVLAAPVGSAQAAAELAEVADEVVCPVAPRGFGAVSRYYDDFRQVTDEEVVRLLAGAARSGPPAT